MKRLATYLICLMVGLVAMAADPTATTYTRIQCQGTSMPYPTDINPSVYPDSLTPVMINHVGRHGSRFPSSAKYVKGLLAALSRADSAGTLTPTGKNLQKLCNRITAAVQNRWGALDSLGMAEERTIASRMFLSFKKLLGTGKPEIRAYCSYSPRCIMSMYEFTHQLARLNNQIETTTASGRKYSPQMRFFDLNEEYKSYIEQPEWRDVYDGFVAAGLNSEKIARRMVGERYAFEPQEADEFCENLYKVISGCAAMSLSAGDTKQYITDAEYNALWASDNLKHYLTYSASTLSLEPAYMAAPLLEDLIATTDSAVEKGAGPAAILRFGHAETLMPLLALMHVPGCYYMTNLLDTVALHWRDFYIVPMAANLQMILFRSKKGNYYLRTDLNEVPVPLVPGRSTLYTPWPVAKEYLRRCMPLYLL